MTSESKPEARLHAVVHGLVQGVNFRYYTIRTAQRLGLTGWVANRRDGTVETVAEGPRQALEELLTFLHRGSPAARVQKVDARWETPSGEFERFRVWYV
ncbi:MAG: acylphosphatase [Chloroflexi bacterium]|nr:MAG: acylphosphatase [Chloroflexota bacterium]